MLAVQLQSFQMTDEARSIEEALWRQFFRNPSVWWNKRTTKRTPRSPDFTHVTTGKSLWIQSWHCPAWVPCQLEHLDTKVSTSPTAPRPTRSKKQIILDCLAGIKSSRSLEQGRNLHAEAAELGIDEVIYVASSLVNMYSRFGCMQEARKVFDTIFHRDVVLWTVLIMGYARAGQGEAALQVFQEMMNSEAGGYPAAPPDGQTFVAALKACASVLARGQGKVTKLEVLERVMVLHAEAERSGFHHDMFVTSSLVDLYSRCRSMRDARRVFDGMESRSVVSWTVLMMGYVTCGENEVALELFSRMLSEGCIVDSQVLVAAFKACSGLETTNRLVKVETGMALHREAQRFVCSRDVHVGSSLVDMYSKCGSMEDARRVFDVMALTDVVSCTALLFGYAQNGENVQALEIFSRMLVAVNLSFPNAQSFVAALHACTNLAAEERAAEVEGKLVKMKSLEKAFAIHQRAVQAGVDSDLWLSSTLVDLYSKCGYMSLARSVFDRMERQDDVAWTALMLGHAQNEEAERALELFFSRSSSAEGSWWKPDNQTYVAALKACCSIGSLEFGKLVQGEIYKNGTANDAHVENSLVDLQTKCGSMSAAQHIFDSSPSASGEAVLWNSLITGYGRQGNAASVMEVFQRMEEQGVEPDGITSLAVLNACGHAGLVDQGEKYFAAFQSRCCPTGAKLLQLEHYHCMVDMLGRANQVEKAVEMVESMPHEADVYTWTIVLSACQKWKNVVLGELAYKKLVSLDEKQASSYVLMANML